MQDANFRSKMYVCRVLIFMVSNTKFLGENLSLYEIRGIPPPCLSFSYRRRGLTLHLYQPQILHILARYCRSHHTSYTRIALCHDTRATRARLELALSSLLVRDTARTIIAVETPILSLVNSRGSFEEILNSGLFISLARTKRYFWFVCTFRSVFSERKRKRDAASLPNTYPQNIPLVIIDDKCSRA